MSASLLCFDSNSVPTNTGVKHPAEMSAEELEALPEFFRFGMVEMIPPPPGVVGRVFRPVLNDLPIQGGFLSYIDRAGDIWQIVWDGSRWCKIRD